MKNTKILIYEPSQILFRGISYILKQAFGKNIEIYELADYNNISTSTIMYLPDIIMLDMSFVRLSEIKKLQKDRNFKLVALQYSFDNYSILSEFDQVITIFDSEDTIKSKISKLINLDNTQMNDESLSIREKEVLIEIVKGFTNKKIADKLNLSIHTVITHRKNISAKLQIHTIAGLTIYAISNKLITVHD